MRVILKIIGLVVTLPIILVSASFAVSNTGPVVLALWPFETQIALPIVLLLFGVLISGFLLGAITAYLGAGTLRRRARKAEFQVRQLEIAAARAKREAAQTATSTAVSVPQSNRSVAAAE